MDEQATYQRVGLPSKQDSPGPCPVTAERLLALRGDVARLREEKEQEVARRLREARPFGDPRGNDGYLAVKEEEAVLEARIAILEDSIEAGGSHSHRT